MSIEAVSAVIAGIFFLFFFGRNLFLRSVIKKSIKSKDPLVNFSILFSTLAAAGFLLCVCLPDSRPYLLVIAGPPVTAYAGCGLITLGTVFGILGSIHLKRSWRVGVMENERTELVTSGLYKYSRNLYFTASISIQLGMSLVSLSVIVLACALITTALMHAMVLKEEKHLLRMHETAYAEYKKNMPRYILF